MRFKNGKKKIGLIALLSCVLTATVAFAAYTGYNYINGTVTVEGSPFKMVFAESEDSDALEAGGTILSTTAAELTGSAEASDITVLAYDPDERASTIESFNVTLKELGDRVVYSFVIKNTGGATAYLSTVDIAETTMPKNSAGADVTGLQYIVTLDDGAPVMSIDGEPVSQALGLSVTPGEAIYVELRVNAVNRNLFSAWTEDGGDDGSGAYGAEIKLGKITLNWSAVDPSQANT